jgi:hypothetical protein
MLIIFLIITEVFVRFVEIIEPSTCKFESSSILNHLSTSEKSNMCKEYNGIEYDRQSSILLLKPDQNGKYVNINSDGFRGQEFNFTDKDYRVFILGGSTLFGFVSTSDETTITGYLQEKLNKISFSKNIQVVNAGIGDATSIDELYYLKNTILDYNPDLVVMYDGYNDSVYFKESIISYEEIIGNTYFENHQLFIDKESKAGTGIIKILENMDYQTGLGVAIFIKDFSFNLNTSKIQDSNFNKTFELDEKKLRTLENNTITNWSNVCELGKIEGFQTVNMLQPMLGTSNRILHTEEIKNIQERTFADWGTYWKNVEINNDNVSTCDNIHDFRNIFDRQDEVLIYYDAGHTVDFGNEIIAVKMFEVLKPIIENDLKN